MSYENTFPNEETIMKVYVWQEATRVSDNYHDHGGLLVIAEDEAKARTLANSTKNVHVEDGDECECLGDIYGATERVMSFPNAGCC